MGASKSGIDRHVYSIPLPTVTGPPVIEAPLPKDEPVALTDDSKAGYNSAIFSPQSGFYLLTYQGPSTPYQEVVSVANSSEHLFCFLNTAVS